MYMYIVHCTFTCALYMYISAFNCCLNSESLLIFIIVIINFWMMIRLCL